MASHHTPDISRTLAFCQSNHSSTVKIIDVTNDENTFDVGAINFHSNYLEIEYPIKEISAIIYDIDKGGLDTTIWYWGLEKNQPINLLGSESPLQRGWLFEEKKDH